MFILMGILHLQTIAVGAESYMVMVVGSRILALVLLEQINNPLVRVGKRAQVSADSQGRRVGARVKPRSAPAGAKSAVHRAMMRDLEEKCVVWDAVRYLLPHFLLGVAGEHKGRRSQAENQHH